MTQVQKAFEVFRLLKNWPIYLADYYRLIKPRDLTYRLWNGLCFQVRARSYAAVALAEVWIHQVYSPPDYPIRETDVVVDLGANVGFFSVLAGKKARLGRVFAVEPCAENYRKLQANVAANHLTNVTPLRLAIGGTSGERTLFLNQDTVSHSLSSGWGTDQSETVDCITLTELYRKCGIRGVDFLKVDVESAEGEILLNCPKEVIASIRTLVMEVHEWEGSDNVGKFREFFSGHGFAVSEFRGTFIAQNPNQVLVHE